MAMEEGRREETAYALGPAILRMAGSDRRQQARLARCWRMLFHLAPFGGPPHPTDVAIHLIQPGNLPAHPTAMEPLPGPGPIQVWRDAAGFLLVGPGARWWLDPTQGRAVGELVEDFWSGPPVVQRELSVKLFFLLLRQREIHLLHANAVFPTHCGPDASVLLIGDSGSGKTTASLSLIGSGWGYVADDSLMLHHRRGGRVDAHALRRGFACVRQTAARWPELPVTDIALDRDKLLLDLETLYPDRFAPVCRPRLLLFPRVTGAPRSRLIPLNTTRTFTALLSQPRAGILIERTAVDSLLASYQALVSQARGFRFEMGQDMLDQPKRIAALLEALLAAGR